MPLYYLGTGSPGGSTTQLQYNLAGAFAGAAGLTTSDGLSLAITQGTIVADFSQINGTVTWNNSGIVGPAWKLNVADTSSNASALLIDLQVATVSKFKVLKTGAGVFSGIVSGSQVNSSGSISVLSDTASFILGASQDARFTRGGAAATIQMGAADVNGSAVAQGLQVQSAVTGTDQNGANWTFKGSKQTGAGTPGDIIFQTSVKLASGTTQGTPVTGLTITGATTSMQPSVVVGNQALATTATEGFLYIPTCAGTPTGVPTTRAGRIAMIYDTTNHQFWFYDGAWLQPKTPAAAAIITWQ